MADLDGEWCAAALVAGRAEIVLPDACEFNRRQGLMAVEIQTEPMFAASTPSKLLDVDYVNIGAGPGRTYDVVLDGQRFLMVR